MNNIQIYFNPLDSKSVEHYSIPVGTPLIDFLQAEFPDGFAGMLHVLVGVEPLELEDLDYEIKKGERVTMLVMPAFAGFGALIAQTLISAAIATAIGFVINLIFRPSTPGISNDGEESPVYSLSPTRNRARLGEPISAHYGDVVYPPDYAAAPYQFFYEGSNDMFIDELLCLGQGDFSVEDVYIGDTPVLAMEPGTVRYWLFDSTEHPTFKQIEDQVWTDVQDTDLPWPFRENVYTAPEVDGFQFNGDRSNQVLTPQSIDGTAVAGSYDPVTDTYVQGEINNITYVPPDETEAGLNPTVGNLRSGDVIDLQNTASNNITFTIESIVYSSDGLTMTLFEGRGVLLIQDEVLPGGTTYTANVNPPSMIAGPYRAQREGSLVNSIDCDIIFVGGLYRVDGTSGNIKTNTAELTFTYQEIDPITGIPIGGPSTVVRTWVSKKRGDLRATVRSGVLTEGAYEVTVEWSAGWDDDNRKHSEPTWVALKGNIVLDTNAEAYGPVTMMAIRMKATNGLGGAATSRVRVKATRTLAAGNSNNPITVIKDIWTSTDYGMGRPLNELDLATMDPLEIEWDGTAGPRFNGSFDSRATGMEAMQSVASMTGGKIVQDGGLTTIVFDGINLVRTALYTSGNIIQDSMQIIYTFDTDGDFDGVTVEYRDPQNFDALYYTYPVTATSPESYVLFGVTDTTYAQQFATYLWNVKSNRRKLCRFTTELEGLLPRFNDRIGVAHPMPAWAESGVVVEVIDDNTVQVDKYLNWTNNNIVIFRDEVGEPTNTLPVTKGSADNVLVFQDSIGTFVNGPEGIDPTNFVFGTENNMVRDFILTKITPKSDTKVEIEAQTYTPTVYLGAPPHMGVLVCVGWGVSETLLKMEQIWRVSSPLGSSMEQTIRRLVQADGLMVTHNDKLWQVEMEVGGDWEKNTMRYSDDFGQSWGAGEVERPYDAWWDEVDGSYNTKRNGSGYISMKLIGERLFANYFWEDNRQSLFVSTVGGRGAIDGQGNPWTPVHCTYSNAGVRTYTAAHAKIVSHAYHFTRAGGSSILIGGKSQETGGWHAVPGPSGRVDGSEESTSSPPAGVPATEYRTYNQYRVPPYDTYGDNCYQIENNGFVFMGSDDDNLWIYDPYTPPGGTLPEALNDTFWNGSQWAYNDQAGTAWRHESVGDYRRNSVLHDMGVADLSPRWGWTNDGVNICMPFKNIASDADPDFGKYYQFEYIQGDPGGLNPTVLDYSALLTSSDGSETNVATVRLFYDEKMARYLLVWSWFQSATGDGWPQRLYIRASHTTDPADFSDAVQVDHLDGFGGLLMNGLRDSGGYALDYSKSEAKFTVSTAYLVAAGFQFDQILTTFDDPFVCNIWEPET